MCCAEIRLFPCILFPNLMRGKKRYTPFLMQNEANTKKKKNVIVTYLIIRAREGKGVNPFRSSLVAPRKTKYIQNI